MTVLEKGVPGSGMPYFSVYTGGALKGLMGYLYREVGIRETLEPVPVATTPDDEREAALVFQQCAECHGTDGKVSRAGRDLQPPTRDMAGWALNPTASFRTVTGGIPGTVMRGYDRLPEGVRWALVKHMHGFYFQKDAGTAK
jgi:hypothetical protein